MERDEDHEGAVMTERTIEERLAEVERVQHELIQLVKTAGGRMRDISPDTTLDDLIKMLSEIGGNLVSTGRLIDRGRHS